jgi:hypothetical protein
VEVFVMVKRSLRKPWVFLLGALGALSLLALIALTRSVNAGDGKWAPAEWSDIGILEILTTGPEEGEHWSKLWLVVIDDQLYLRLGSRATERVERNTTAPYVSVKIAGQRFDRVRAEHVPEFRERVAEAMAKKYLSDLIIRFFPHPMTVRLTPETRLTRGPGGTSSRPSDLLGTASTD